MDPSRASGPGQQRNDRRRGRETAECQEKPSVGLEVWKSGSLDPPWRRPRRWLTRLRPLSLALDLRSGEARPLQPAQLHAPCPPPSSLAVNSSLPPTPSLILSTPLRRIRHNPPPSLGFTRPGRSPPIRHEAHPQPHLDDAGSSPCFCGSVASASIPGSPSLCGPDSQPIPTLPRKP